MQKTQLKFSASLTPKEAARVDHNLQACISCIHASSCFCLQGTKSVEHYTTVYLNCKSELLANSSIIKERTSDHQVNGECVGSL